MERFIREHPELWNEDIGALWILSRGIGVHPSEAPPYIVARKRGAAILRSPLS
jgi:hypothetical protein